jgi:hypothetical protein
MVNTLFFIDPISLIEIGPTIGTNLHHDTNLNTLDLNSTMWHEIGHKIAQTIDKVRW